MKRFIYFLFLTILFASCDLSSGKDPLDGVKFKRASHNNEFYLMVPTFTTSTTKLHEDASIQYNNPMKEFYVIVVNEPKKTLQDLIDENELMMDYFPSGTVNVNSYYNFVVKGLAERGEDIHLSDSSSATKINNLQGRLVSAVGMLNRKHKIFYRIGVFEGKDEVYQVFTWTMEKYKNKYKPVMDSVLHSLAEIR
jgi:hypothetical protein